MGNMQGVVSKPVGSTRPGLLHWLLHALPYIVMLGLGVFGASWTSVVGKPTAPYWVALAPAFAVIAIIAGWRHVDSGSGRVRLVVLLALNACALLVAMYLLFMPEVRGVLNDNAMSLSLLTLLAFGTFVSGLLSEEWRICIVGVFLAFAVPVIAWLDQAVTVLALGAVVLIVIGAIVWLITHRLSRGAAA